MEIHQVKIHEAKSQRRIGQAGDLVLHLADDFDAPLEDFQDYME